MYHHLCPESFLEFWGKGGRGSFVSVLSLFYKHASFPVLSLFYKHASFPEYKSNTLGFPGGSVVKYLPANAGGLGSVLGLGRSHM